MSIANQASNVEFPSYGLPTGGGDPLVNVTVQGNVIQRTGTLSTKF